MKRLLNWKVLLGILLIVLSVVTYTLHYILFHDAHHIFIYLVGDVAFVFIEVLLVTLILHQLLNEWEKRSRLQKLNMVIEVFFSEFGKQLLRYLSNADTNLGKIRDLIVSEDCENFDFRPAFKVIKDYRSNIDMDRIDLHELSSFLTSKRHYLIDFLQNPNMLQHASFTESLMAIFHITEELAARDLDNLSPEDIEHTKTDIKRAYNLLVAQWLSYMQHTKKHYPYFFVFAMRTNPFDDKAPWLMQKGLE